MPCLAIFKWFYADTRFIAICRIDSVLRVNACSYYEAT